MRIKKVAKLCPGAGHSELQKRSNMIKSVGKASLELFNAAVVAALDASVLKR